MKRTHLIGLKSLNVFVWPLLLSATAYCAGPANPNLVLNGSFENCGTQWTLESGSVNCVGTFWQTADGSFLMELNGTDPGTIYQDLATQCGRNYTIRFAYAGDPAPMGECAPGIKTFNVSWDGTQIGSLQFDTTGKDFNHMGWQYYHADVTASGNLTRLRFQSTTQGQCGPALDDVRVIVKSIKLATVNGAEGWAFYPFLNGGGSQGGYYSTTAAINVTGLTTPAPQPVYQRLQTEYSTVTIDNLIPTVSYRVRVHLSSIEFSGWQNVSQNVWVSNGGSPNSVNGVNPYASGFNKATIVDLGQIYPNYPGNLGKLSIGISPSGPGKTISVSGVEIYKEP